MKVLEVMCCRSSVARAMVVRVKGPGFNSTATTEIFFTFAFAFL